MLSRRAFIAGAPLALAGCDFGEKISAAVDQIYVTNQKAAQKLEDAIGIARKDVKAAVAFLAPYARPAAQIAIMLGGFIRRLIAMGALDSKTQSVKMALDAADKLAVNPLIIAIANGTMPADLEGVLVAIIQGAMLVMDLTQFKATPTAAVAK